MALTPEQKAAVKAAVQADPALATAWAARRYGDVTNALNLADQANGDVDVQRETILRALALRGVSGKTLARIDVLRAQVAAAIAAAQSTAALEARLATLHGATEAFDKLPSFLMSKGPERAFIVAAVDALIAEGVAASNDRGPLLNLGKAAVSRAYLLTGGSLNEGEVIESMK